MTKAEYRTIILTKILNYLNSLYSNEYTTFDFKFDTIARELFHQDNKPAGKPPYEDIVANLAEYE